MEDEDKINEEVGESADDVRDAGADAELQKDFDELKKQAEEYLDGWKRARADYANLQKEREKERKEIVEFANSALIAELLPIYTNLKKAVWYAEKFGDIQDAGLKNWIAGVKFIKKQWEDIFKVVGIEEIKTVGEKFDPEFHEAVKKGDQATERSSEQEAASDGIVEELEPGYTFKGKVIYPAKVVVS